MSKLPISVIIVARNAEKTIEDCLKSVQNNCPSQIIIIDDQSQDKTLEISRKYTKEIYSNEGWGISFARQLGLNRANQEYVSFVDSDITLTEGSLAQMLEEVKTLGYANIQARQQPTRCDTYWEWAVDQHYKLRESRNTSQLSACVLRKDIALKINFDPSIRIAGEDFDFLTRLQAEGFKVGVSTAVVYHVHRSNFKSFVKQRFWYGRSLPFLIKKYFPGKKETWAPGVMLYWLGWSVVKGKFKMIPYFLVNGVVETLGMIKGFGELVKYQLTSKTN